MVNSPTQELIIYSSMEDALLADVPSDKAEDSALRKLPLAIVENGNALVAVSVVVVILVESLLMGA